MRQNEMASLAMRMNLCLATSVVGSVQQSLEILILQDLKDQRKIKAVLNSVG
jgi:hypothetical protein